MNEKNDKKNDSLLKSIQLYLHYLKHINKYTNF